MSGGVPAGWALVPVEPTEAMVKAASVAIEKAEPDNLEPGDEGFFWGCSWQNSARDAYRAMLAATPPVECRDKVAERGEKAVNVLRRLAVNARLDWLGRDDRNAVLDALQALGERG